MPGDVTGPAAGGTTEVQVEVDHDLDRVLDDGARRIMTSLTRQNTAYRHMIEVCDRIADATLTGASARRLAQLLADLLGRTVVLLDPRFGLRAHAGVEAGAARAPWQPDDPGIGRLLRALAAERRPLRVPAVPDSVLRHGCLAVPIGIGATALGYLLILDAAGGGDEEAVDDVDLLVGSYVATLFALTLSTERTSIDLGMGYRAAVVDALVSGQFTDPDDARRKLDALGLTDESTFQVGIIRPAGERGSDQLAPTLADELGEAVRQVVPDAGTVVRQTELVVIVPGRGSTGDDAHAAHRLRRVVERRTVRGAAPARLVCGVSDPAGRPEDAPRLYREARHAVEIGCRISRFGPVVSYAELGIFRLLLQIGDERELATFADTVLGPIIRYDATHKLALVHTLSVFLNQRESLKQAARRLHVHANTVTYRLQRIEQLTPLRLADPEDRLVAHVAVKILELQQHGCGAD